MKQIIRGKYLITMNEKDQIIENGALLVENGKIIDIDIFEEIFEEIQ